MARVPPLPVHPPKRLVQRSLALDVLAHPDDYTPPNWDGEYRGSDGPLAYTVGGSPSDCAAVLGWVLARLERQLERSRSSRGR